MNKHQSKHPQIPNNMNQTMNTNITDVKIASWNLCLGLRNKKEYVSNVINENKIDVCCLQEVDIEPNYPTNLLSFKGYSIEIENNTKKARSGIYINNKIPYTRMSNLEGQDCGLVIIDLHLSKTFRIINVYRVINPVNNTSQFEFFKNQLKTIKLALESKTNNILIGDFN